MKINVKLLMSLFLLFYLISCDKELPQQNGELTLVYNEINTGDNNKSISTKKTTPKYFVISIKNSLGEFVLTTKKIELVKLMDGYISEHIELENGNYTVEDFLVLDENDSTIYFTPKIGTKNDNLVSTPLPVAFSIKPNETTLVTLDVTPTNLGFYPLSIGNIWSYELNGYKSTTTFDCPCYVTKGYITEKVKKDTLINDLRYYIIERIGKIEPSSSLNGTKIYYLRYDEENLKIYSWNLDSMQEHLMIDFNAEINQAYEGYKLLPPSGRSYHISTLLVRKYDSLVFEKNEKVLDFQETYYYAEGEYSFSQNIGLISQFYLDEIERYEIKLIGFKINDSIKGDLSNIE